ncbi:MULTISPECIES: chaplin [Streptomyces]|uniref:Chaplin family protein n=1 Tax=Streptomyces ramulosus TaxID=47762 RepID=A0ABW1FQR0_9ACTN
MRQVARKGLITVAAAGGILAATVGYAHADAGAQGGAANSPGVASGNNVQVPVHVPVNACGNTVDVVGLLNPAFGNTCVNDSGGHRTSPGDGHHDQGGKSAGQGGGHGGHGATAEGGAVGSPGVASGNDVQVPVDIPVNACGNSADVVGLLNPTFGNECGNGAVPTRPVEPGHPAEPGNPEQPQRPGEPVKEHPSTPSTPGPRPQTASHVKIADTPEPTRELAHTGAGPIGYAASASAGLMLGGALLYRRARTARR